LLFSMTLFAQAPTSFQYGVRTPTLFPWNGTNKIDVNGRLKLNTTAGGLIPPQLTTTQRLAIASPETGESVYDVTLGKYYHWDGSGWVASAGGAVATDDLEATLTAGNSANNDFNLIGPSGAITNYAGGYLQAQDISGDVTTRIGLTTEATGATNFYLNLIETGSNAKTNAASLGLASEYFSTNGTRTVNFKVPFKSSGTYTVATTADIVPPTLPEFQIAVGQVGDVFGSSSDLTYEGGDLKVLGVEVMTVDDGQPLDSDLTAIAALTTTSYGRGFLPLTDAAAARTYIGAGTGSGTVTSVTGVSGETTVASGTTTPVIGISSTYTTARDSYADAKVQNNMTASTTVAPSATAVSTEYNSASALTFSGPIDLSKKGGSYYAEHTQTGAITFSVSATTVGGLAQVTILANGSAINLVGGWINVGGEPVSTTNGTTNYMVIWQTNNKVFYSVKVY